MRATERVGIKNLKNNLSAYIREVRKGVRILVTDREEVVAELRKPTDAKPREDIHPLLAEWIRTGKVIPPRAPKRPLPASPVKLKAGTALYLLDQDRGE